jgi:reactive intermediate/imine deaminase
VSRRETPAIKRTISTEDATAAVDAVGQATAAGDLLVTAGQLPITPAAELLEEASVAERTRQCLRNVAAILRADGRPLADVLKTTVFLDDIHDFDAFDETSREFLNGAPPPVSAVGPAGRGRRDRGGGHETVTRSPGRRQARSR